MGWEKNLRRQLKSCHHGSIKYKVAAGRPTAWDNDREGVWDSGWVLGWPRFACRVPVALHQREIENRVRTRVYRVRFFRDSILSSPKLSSLAQPYWSVLSYSWRERQMCCSCSLTLKAVCIRVSVNEGKSQEVCVVVYYDQWRLVSRDCEMKIPILI